PPAVDDGVPARVRGRLTLQVNRGRVDGIVVVSDAEIVRAMSFLFERMKVVVEPSGAVALAAVLAGRFDPSGRRVGVVLSGGNVSARRFAGLGAPFTGCTGGPCGLSPGAA